MGAPGSGKGTIAAHLVERFDACHISSGDLLREAVKRDDTAVAHAAAEAMRKGELVEDDVVGALVYDALRCCLPGQMIMLDGYPRNEAQMIELARREFKVEAAIWLDVPEEVLLNRMAGRRRCSQCNAGYHITNIKPQREGICDRCGGRLVQREDDKPEHVLNRLAVYRRQTEQLIDLYEKSGVLQRIVADEALESVLARVVAVVTS